ncbi:MAG: protein-methionine-sulfoxide reductase heme-binding subunit MsrQ [Methylocystis sp.]
MRAWIFAEIFEVILAPLRQLDRRLAGVRPLAVYVVGFVPAIWLLFLAFSGSLGPEPARALEQSLGLWALRFLVLVLSVSPLRRIFSINLLRLRRAFGLLAFYYAALHLTAYVLFDHALNWSEIVTDIIKRPYVLIGMVAFCLMIPLAATSNNRAIVFLGGNNWARLHRLTYIVAAAAALHFALIVKTWSADPFVYVTATFGLLALRLRAPRG